MPLKMKVRNVLGAAMICAQVVGATGQAQAADRFVSTAGSDTANDCLTGASPCRTVAHGLARGEWGHTEGAGGRFRENPTVSNPTTLTLSGGWAEGFSVRDPDLMRTALWSRSGRIPPLWGLFSRSLCRMPTSSCRLAISGPQRRPKLS